MIRLRIVQLPPATELRYGVDVWQPRTGRWRPLAIGPERDWVDAVEQLVEAGAIIVADARQVGVTNG